MKIGDEELDIVQDMEKVKLLIEECPVDKQRTLLDHIARDIVIVTFEVSRCYDAARENKSRPTPKRCYADMRRKLTWLQKANRVFQLARMKWQDGLKMK